MPCCELLVGSAAFWDRAARDIAAARERVLVQAMTFEGDAAGMQVADAVGSSGAADRRVLVDDYSRHVVNDRLVAAPLGLFDRAFRAEVAATRAMFDGLVRGGVGVRVTNPIGRNPLRYALRNHKKLIVADEVAYVGGINFSDHNFLWHDLMLRIEGADVASFLAGDFDATWRGAPLFARAAFGDIALYALDGTSNDRGFADLFAAIAAARRSIEIVSAYPTMPFVEALGAAAARGVSVRLLTPLPNNKPLVRDYLIGAAEPLGIEVRLLAEMTHLKAMLIDGETLVLGSSNFDFASFHVEEEILAIATGAELIAAFRRTVLLPAVEAALPPGVYRPSPRRRRAASLLLRGAEAVVKRMRGARRGAVDWPAPERR